jgi:photosystem II stability/assembly factor-like uncharacterized protein
MKHIIILLLSVQSVCAQTVPDDLLKNFFYRNIGPFRMGAWVTGFAVPEKPQQSHLYTFYVATRHGGLWKTINNGTTYEDIFPHHYTIGAVAVAPTDANIVWAGTGESYIARSSYSGDGVYRSNDAGKTWQHMGLKETQHIVRIIIHPKNPDIVYVVSPGHLFTPNAERGVFKTTNGGKNWEKVFFINDNTGAIDLVMHPNNPDILYTASYEKYRSAWNLESGGPNSAIHKSLDGGKTWKKLSGGLPSGTIGRIGIDLCRKKPETVYAVIENLNVRAGAAANATRGGELYRSDDGGNNWRKMSRDQDDLGGKAAYSFNQLTVHPENPDRVFVTGVAIANSRDGGKTWDGLNFGQRQFFPGSFGDVRTFWIDHQNPDRMLFGSDGGVHISYDAGKTCDYYDNFPVGEIYAIGLDNDEPYNVYAGLQDHDSWKGPSNGWSGSITLENWVPVGSDDGMYNVIDPTDSRWVYNTGQFGIHRRVDQQKGIRANIEPKPKDGLAKYRYNWCTPLLISPHDPSTVYTGSQYLMRSKDRGDNWEAISPDLTSNDPKRINGKGHIQFCTITTMDESTVERGVIWVGTDDGKVWVTRDNGANWKEVTAAIEKAGGPSNKWVSRVMASYTGGGTAYVTKNGFRNDDFAPYLFKTTDYGNTWQPVMQGLPQQPLNVVVEDKENPQLLFAGHDAGVHVSFNGGKNWRSLKGNMPMVPVHDLKIHTRDKDLVVGTYGRGIWIADISWLEEINDALFKNDTHLFTVEEKYYRVPRLFGANYQLYGQRHIRVPNEPNGLVINYYLDKIPVDSTVLMISDASGKMLFQTRLMPKQGMNTYTWNFNAAGRGAFSSIPSVPISPGELTVQLKASGKEMVRKTKYKGVKGWPVN